MPWRPDSPSTDAQWLARLVRRPNDPEADRAWQRLYARHARRTLSYLAARLPEPICEELQATVWSHVRSARASVLRRPVRVWLLELTRAAARPALANGAAEFQRRSHQFSAAIATLEPHARDVIQWRLGNRSFAAIAEVTGHRIERLIRLHHEALARLQASIAPALLWVRAFPDDRAAAPAWLERHLVGARLGAVVAELSAIHETTASQPAILGAVLSGWRRDAVLKRGLSELSPRRIAALLTHPRLLLDLQSLILAWGGPIWDAVRPIDEQLNVMSRRTWQRLAPAA